MLTRPGSKPGPTWMRNISDSLADPDRARAVMMPFWALFILYLLAILLLTHFITAIARSKDHIYESPQPTSLGYRCSPTGRLRTASSLLVAALLA